MYNIVYLNNDGKTLFGSPWEMMFVDSYLVRTKSGSILGYSSQFSYVPELGLSKFMYVCCYISTYVYYNCYQLS